MRLNRGAIRLSIAFLGSFLLFSVEVLATKMLLPSFGGAAYVWTTACMFFQAALLAGYLYSEGALAWLGAGRYVPFHLVLLLLPTFFFPLTLRLPAELVHPAADLLKCLIFAVGVPFLVLSTTSPVIQSWSVASGEPSDESYRIFAASNTGALLALLSYPFLVEPYLGLRTQLRWWHALYVLYAGLHLLCLPLRKHHHKASDTAASSDAPDDPSGGGLVWFLLSLGPSASMLACTNLLTLDFAAVPLLWIAPLAVYLVTFILNFKRNPWYPKRLSMMFVAAMLIWLAFVMLTVMFSLDIGQQWIAFRRLWAVNKLVFMCASLFIVCMICHKALSQSKPAGRHAARFYAWVGAGGWAGSVLIGVLLPWLGRRTARPEIDWAISGGISLLALIARDRKQIRDLAASGKRLDSPAEAGGPSAKLKVSVAALCAAIVILGAGFGFYVNRSLTFANGVLFAIRNFYGYYTVVDVKGFRKFYHGNTLHGMQYLDPARQDTPLVYYWRGSPIAELLRLNQAKIKDVAVIGLGVGVLAADGYAGQRFDFYELDPDVAAIAEQYFVFLKDSPSKYRIHTGDGRLVLAREEGARYDLLIVDAFTGGAIPVHLLTQEAFELYLQRLNAGGILAVHVTNRFLNLRPVVAALARAAGLSVVGRISHPKATANDEDYYSSWTAMAKDPQTLAPLRAAGWSDLAPLAGQTRPWTDDYASLWAALGN